MGSKGITRKVFVADVAALAGLLRGSYRNISGLTRFKMNTHVNISKHYWNRGLKNPSNANVKRLTYKAIKNGKWSIQSNGSIKIKLLKQLDI
ncbi:hypothetical protein [Terrisporobacter mayombei]|uniref:hypothetical protein n=1 Tax=Terrisporobacter mayombei TaxID=1541 RepID=UPI001D1682CC|nr:hypothetical protein [Terrisporobacter mayombei]